MFWNPSSCWRHVRYILEKGSFLLLNYSKFWISWTSFIIQLDTKRFKCSTAPIVISVKGWWLTYDFHFVGGIDLSCFVENMAGVFPAVLRSQVLQTQSPPLLLFRSCDAFLVDQRPAVFQPDDVRPRVAARCTLQAHGAADRASDDAFPHLCWLGETWTNCTEEKWTQRLKLLMLYLNLNKNTRMPFISLTQLQVRHKKWEKWKSGQTELLVQIKRFMEQVYIYWHFFKRHTSESWTMSKNVKVHWNSKVTFLLDLGRNKNHGM